MVISQLAVPVGSHFLPKVEHVSTMGPPDTYLYPCTQVGVTTRKDVANALPIDATITVRLKITFLFFIIKWFNVSSVPTLDYSGVR
jgi:hypothetical protein